MVKLQFFYINRRRSSLNFRGHKIFALKYVFKKIKNQQNARILHDMPEFCIILARKIIKVPEFLLFAPKIYKIPEFYMIFVRKNHARILHNYCPKNIFSRNFRAARALPAPVSYAYGSIP